MLDVPQLLPVALTKDVLAGTVSVTNIPLVLSHWVQDLFVTVMVYVSSAPAETVDVVTILLIARSTLFCVTAPAGGAVAIWIPTRTVETRRPARRPCPQRLARPLN